MDHTIADHFDTQCPRLMDSFLYLHPTKRTFTRVCNTSAARLDCILLSTTLLTYVSKAYIRSGQPSDHRVVITRLSPASPPEVGPGLPKARAHFFFYETLVESFSHFLTATLLLLPADDEALVHG
jgi:hypothetical protein